MFEPEELMARIVDLEEQLKVSEMAPPAAEQLIACLEGEIAKRDARIVELENELSGIDFARRVSLQNESDLSDTLNQLRAELAAVKAQEGRYVMLEGRIASVGERSQRTYLNFSRRPKEAASIVLSRSLWRELKSAGWTASDLGGKRLRAYGVLSGRDGLLLEVASRTALELID